MSHKPAGCFKDFNDYLNQPEIETNKPYDIEKEDFVDEYRTEKEKREDYADYLRDKEMDWQHELKERDMGAR